MCVWHEWLGSCVSGDTLTVDGRIGCFNTGYVGGRTAPAGAARVGKDDCGSEINKFDDVALCQHAVVELEVSVCKTE